MAAKVRTLYEGEESSNSQAFDCIEANRDATGRNGGSYSGVRARPAKVLATCAEETSTDRALRSCELETKENVSDLFRKNRASSWRTCSFPTTTDRSIHGRMLCTTISRMKILRAFRSSSESSCPRSIDPAAEACSPTTSSASMFEMLRPARLRSGTTKGAGAPGRLQRASTPRARGRGVAAVGAAEKRGRRAVWRPYVLRMVS